MNFITILHDGEPMVSILKSVIVTVGRGRGLVGDVVPVGRELL